MKFHHVLTLISLTQAAYISRMTVNRVRAPTAFRPGVTLQRPWTQRLVPAASFRTPYVVYRPPPHRYTVKHYAPTTRNVFNSPWKTTPRVPGMSPVSPEYEFVRAASSSNILQANSGAIHTIPAPNLSLSEKPIVVVDNTHRYNPQQKPTYEVTENPEHNIFQVAKISTPIGFSKQQQQNIQSTQELNNLIKNGAALQMAAEYGLSAISVPQAHRLVPQEFTVQQGPNIVGFNGLPSQQDLINSGAEGIMIPPNALYQSDPLYLQKLQSQLLQRFPAVEFIPYAAEVLNQNLPQVQHNPNPPQIQHKFIPYAAEVLNQNLPQVQHNPNPQQIQHNPNPPQIQHNPNPPQIQHNPNPPQRVQELLLLENEELKQQDPFLQSETKNVFQRETQEGSVVTLIPQKILVANVTTEQEPTTTAQPHTTLELEAAETRPVSTTIKYIIETTEKQNTTPIYYAQIGRNIEDLVAKGFYSAVNEIRESAALEQMEKPQEVAQNDTATISPDRKPFFVQKSENTDNKSTEIKPFVGVPFTKPVNVAEKADAVKVAYTLLRTEEKEPKTNEDGAVFAGQIVEASITEDQEFNKEKANMIKRPPLRLFAITEKQDVTTAATTSTPNYTVVKAKIPPKSKLTFDEQTGEPVLRIYASYVDNPSQKESITAKLLDLKQAKNTVDNWKSATVKALDKTQGFDRNQLTQFGLKLRSRSDDYIPLFEEYDE